MSFQRKIVAKEGNAQLVDYTEKSLVVFGFPFEDRSLLSAFTQGNGYTRIDDNGVVLGKDFAFMTAKSNETNLAILDAYFGKEWRAQVVIPEKRTYGKDKIETNKSQPVVVKQEIVKSPSDIFMDFTKLIDKLEAVKELNVNNVGENQSIIVGPLSEVDDKLKEYPSYEVVCKFETGNKKMVYIDY